MKNMEEVMMGVVYSRDDEKLTLNEKNNSGANSPLVDESNMEASEECKQDVAKIDKKNADKENTKGAIGDSPSDSESNQDAKRKRKHRRRQKGGKHHRRWKPYDKMSWTEKQALEEKETKRATQKREEAFASGHPVAPYNTTQFLMDDHCKNEAISPDLHRHNSKDSNASNSSETSSDFYDDDENEGFQHKNFMDTFNDFRMQELMNKSKEDLVRDYVDLELKLERFQDGTNRNKCSSRESSDSLSSSGERGTSDYSQLKAENEQLKTQYKMLQAKIRETDSVQSSDVN